MGEGRQQPDLGRQLLQLLAVAEDEVGEGRQLPDLGRQLLQLLAAGEVEVGEGRQVPDLGRQHLQLLAAAEDEVGEGRQLPDLGRQHLQPDVPEVELLDAVTAPPDAVPRAWALALGPPLLQSRARRPDRPQHASSALGISLTCVRRGVASPAGA